MLLATQTAQSDDPSAPADPSAVLAQLEQTLADRTKAVDENTNLDASARQAAEATLQQAQDLLQAADSDRAELQQLVADRLGAPAILQRLASGDTSAAPSALPDGWNDGTLAQLDVVLAEADAAARAAVQRSAQLRADLADLANQAPQIGPQLATARQSLAATQAELDQMQAAAGAGKRTPGDGLLLARAREQALLAQIALLEEQRDGADIRTQLLTAQLADSERASRSRDADLAAVREAVARRRLSDAVAGSSDWESSPVGHYEQVAVIAQTNRELADLYVGPSAVTHRIDEADDQLAAIERTSASFASDTENLRNRLASLGRSVAAGVLIREALKGLPSTSGYVADLESRSGIIDETQMRIVELNAQRNRLERNFDGATDQIVREIPRLSASEISDARAVVGSLLRSQSKILEPLVRDLERYVGVLTELQSRQRAFVESVDQAAEQLRAQEPWVRNARAVTRVDLVLAVVGLRGIASAELWMHGGEAAAASIHEAPWHALAVAIAVAAGFALLAMLRRLHQALPSSLALHRLRVRLLARSLLSGLGWVLVVGPFGWWLSRVPGAPAGLHELGASLAGISAGVFAVGMLAELFAARGGVGDLRPDLRALADRLRQVAWLLLAMLTLAIASRLLFVAHAEGTASEADLAARLCQLLSAILMAWMIHRVAAVKLRQARLEGRRSRLLAWSSVYAAAMLVPVLFIVLLVHGFLVAAWELTRTLFATLLVVAVAATVRTVITVQADEIPAGETAADAALRRGRAQLQRIVLFLFAAAVLVWIWRDVIDALNYLQNVALWTSETATGLRTVTVANVLSCTAVLGGTLIAFWALPLLAGTQSIDTTTRGVGTKYALVTLVRYVVLLVGVLSAFALLNIGWSKIQWLATGLSVGLGFGLQEIVANFFSGLILLSERSIRVGDLVAVGERTGVVSRIQVRATTLRDFDGREILIPNKEMVATEVTNWTLSNPTRRVHVVVGVRYGTDTELVERLLIEAASEVPGVLPYPAPSVAFEAFGDSALQFRLYAWIEAAERVVVMNHRLNMRVNAVLKEHGIVIPFPQRDVHVVAEAAPSSATPASPQNEKL